MIGFGVFVLNTVASVMPGATVLVALVTYALQLVVMACRRRAPARPGLATTLDRDWFARGRRRGHAGLWMGPRSCSATAGADPGLRPPGRPARVRDDPPHLLLSGSRWLSGRLRRCDPTNPHGDPWLAFGYLVSGVAVYGLMGWGLDRWLGTSFLVAIGIVFGAALAST